MRVVEFVAVVCAERCCYVLMLCRLLLRSFPLVRMAGNSLKRCRLAPGGMLADVEGRSALLVAGSRVYNLMDMEEDGLWLACLRGFR